MSRCGQALEHLGVGDRVGQTLGVRKVGTEYDAVGTDGLDQADGVFFKEGVDPDVPAQNGDRVLLEEAWLLPRRRAPTR